MCGVYCTGFGERGVRQKEQVVCAALHGGSRRTVRVVSGVMRCMARVRVRWGVIACGAVHTAQASVVRWSSSVSSTLGLIKMDQVPNAMVIIQYGNGKNKISGGH
jgi:hypothetical protein